MKSFISEDAIEKAFINQLVLHNGWKHIECDPSPDAKTNLRLSHFVDMAVQGYGWIVAA